MPLNQYEIDHLAVVRENAPESMVLLASDGSFPLAGPGELALYGLSCTVFSALLGCPGR